MAQQIQLRFCSLIVIQLICFTIASHPTKWRRNAESRETNIMEESAEPVQNPEESSEEIQPEEPQSALPTNQARPSTTGSGSTTTMCPTCWMQEQQKQFRIDSVKKQIMKKLRLSHVPNVTGPPPKNPALRHLINDPELLRERTFQADQPRLTTVEEDRASVERLFIFAKRPAQLYDLNASECCYFNVAEKTQGYHVTSAKLYFYITPAKVVQTTLHQLVVKMIMAPAGNSNQAKLRTVANIKTQLSTRTGEWRSVGFTNVVQGWAAEPETNLGIVIELFDNGGNLVVVTGTSLDEPKRPFLQLRLEEESQRRRMKRQSTRMCSEDEQQGECCLYPLQVSFEQFGWDWIIAPKQYEANYCFGSCPNHYVYQYPHTQLISQLDQMAVAGPCCSPSQMRSVSLLLFDEDYDITYAELPDMSVEACNCS